MGAGLAGDEMAAAEAALEGPLPAELAFFSETGARAVVSTRETSLADLYAVAAKWNVAIHGIGRVTRGEFRLAYNGAMGIRDSPAALRAIWTGAIEQNLFGEQVSERL